MTTPHSSHDIVPNVIPIGVVDERFQGMGRNIGNHRNLRTTTSQKTRLTARWNNTETIELHRAATIPANAEPLSRAARNPAAVHNPSAAIGLIRIIDSTGVFAANQGSVKKKTNVTATKNAAPHRP
jgi:hypothetical protein